MAIILPGSKDTPFAEDVYSMSNGALNWIANFIWGISDMVLNVRIGYEIRFTRYFNKLQLLRTLGEISASIQVLQKEKEGLLDEIIGGSV